LKLQHHILEFQNKMKEKKQEKEILKVKETRNKKYKIEEKSKSK
jgi:hypothetical protein